jgi:hypothetical protein
MRTITRFFILFLLAFSVPVQAQYTLTANDVTFSNGEITSYLNTVGKDIIIPDNFGGAPVISLGYQSFTWGALTAVTIPNSVTTIRDEAFAYNRLTSIIIPNSVTTIGEYSFNRDFCRSVTIPNSITTIEAGAFYDNHLTSVAIPNSVTTITNGAFDGNDLTSFNLPANYQGNIHSWSDDEGNTYKNGDLVSDLRATYILADFLETGISSTDKNIFSLYPNPSTHYIHSGLETSTLTIGNSQGVVVSEFKSKETKYNVSDLESGVYFIEARGLYGLIYRSKLIKE